MVHDLKSESQSPGLELNREWACENRCEKPYANSHIVPGLFCFDDTRDWPYIAAMPIPSILGIIFHKLGSRKVRNKSPLSESDDKYRVNPERPRTRGTRNKNASLRRLVVSC